MTPDIELEGMTDEEVVAYLDENKWEFPIEGGSEDSLGSEFEFNRDIIKDKYMNVVFNISMLVFLILFISGILIYKYKGKITPVEMEIRNRKK